MKKIAAMLLVICMLLSVCAFAQEMEEEVVLTCVRVNPGDYSMAYQEMKVEGASAKIPGSMLLVEKMDDGSWYHIVRGNFAGFYIARGFVDPLEEELAQYEPFSRNSVSPTVKLFKERLRELGFVREEGTLNEYYGASLTKSAELFFEQMEIGEPETITPGLIHYILNTDNLPTYNGDQADLPEAK